MKKEFLFLFFLAIVFVVPVFWLSRNLTFRLDSDYDTVLPTFHHVVESIRNGKGFPFWNPYIGTGVSTIGDPLSMVLNPFLSFPMIIFGVDEGLRITLFLVIILSGISMWCLLKALGINGFIRIWASGLYETSGGLIAAMAAGHVEKILSYPFIPLFFAFTIMYYKKWSIIIPAVMLTLIFFSGGIYIIWFLTIFFMVIQGYRIIFRNESFIKIFYQTIVVYSLSMALSSVKLIPFVLEVLPKIERYSLIDPFVGSIHIFLAPLAYVMPLKVAFYDRPFFQRLFSFHFNWYEYYAFISPLPFLFLLKIKELLKNKMVVLLLILLCVGALYGALRYPYSPFYWLFHLVLGVRTFRVPQRIFSPMTSLVIGLLALHAQKWRKSVTIFICVLSLAWTFFIGQQTMLMGFEPPRVENAKLAHALRQKDQGNYFVVTYLCCMQTFLVKEHIPILNYYHGWRLKNIPNLEADMSQLSTTRPKYIIAPKSMDFSTYPYEQFLQNNVAIIWKTNQVTITPSL